MIIVKSKVKDSASGCNVGGDFVDALNEKIHGEIKRAAERAEQNGRKTVQAKDLYICDSKKKGPSETLVVKSKMKEVLSGYNVGGDLSDAVSMKIACCIDQAAKRSKANGRKTIQARDL